MVIIYEANLASCPTSSISIPHICVGFVVRDEEPTIEGGLCGPTWGENGVIVGKNGA